MERTAIFAQTPSNPEPIIARVRDELVRDCEAAACPPDAELDRLADAAVRALWDSRVKLFVSVLAVHHARKMLTVAS